MRTIVAVLAVLLAGCQTRAGFEQRLARWNGQPIAEVVKAWGGPNHVGEAPAGEKLYTWEFGRERRAVLDAPRRGTTPASGYGSRMQPAEVSTDWCTVTFVVEDSRVRASRFSGNGCVAAPE